MIKDPFKVAFIVSMVAVVGWGIPVGANVMLIGIASMMGGGNPPFSVMSNTSPYPFGWVVELSKDHEERKVETVENCETKFIAIHGEPDHLKISETEKMVNGHKVSIVTANDSFEKAADLLTYECSINTDGRTVQFNKMLSN